MTQGLLCERFRELSKFGRRCAVSDKKETIKQPVCPYCREKMQPVKYIGYYDEFACWQCDCDKLPDAKEQRGQYA